MVQLAAEEMQEKMSKMREAEETCYKQVNDIAVASTPFLFSAPFSAYITRVCPPNRLIGHMANGV